MTLEERHLWYDFLQSYPVKLRRQAPIGPYIADFYCAAAQLVIELDDSQHYEAPGQQQDEKRSAFLESQGLLMVRYSNREINQEFRAVCEDLDRLIQERIKPSP